MDDAVAQEAVAPAPFTVGVDTGGTFTDIAVLLPDGSTLQEKTPTTPWDYSEGVMTAIDLVASALGLSTDSFLSQAVVKHGCTVATDALLNREGARVGLITTRGFEDTAFIMRAIGRVAGLSDKEIRHQAVAVKPEPLVPKARVRGVTERVDQAGRIVVPLQEDEVRAALRDLVETGGVESVAICFLWSFMNPAHEQQVRTIARELYGEGRVRLSLSSELAPVIREYARTNTAIIDGFLGPTVRGYVDRLTGRLAQAGYRRPLFMMQGMGGLTQPGELLPLGSAGAGPAGGMVAARHLAECCGHSEVVTTDMGGTGFDVGVLADGYWRYEREPVVARFHVNWPLVDVRSIGAGGGTIAWVDQVTGRLRLGPRSAGASPGPVCYDAGGSEPTVTDCDLVLGYLNPDNFMGGRVRISRTRAEAAIRTSLADPLGLSVSEAAAAVYELVGGYMADRIRRHVVTTGHIPEEFHLYAFGGAGPVHAAEYGAHLGVRDVFVFPTAAVFSAFGIAAAQLWHSATVSHRMVLPDRPAELNRRLRAAEESLLQVAEREGVNRRHVRLQRTFLLRYRRQLNELELAAPVADYSEADLAEIVARFDRRYADVNGEGSSYREAGVELISVRIDACAGAPPPRLPAHPLVSGRSAANALAGRRPVYWHREATWLETPVYSYPALAAGNVLPGPCIVEAPLTTVVIPPACRGEVDRHLSIRLVWEG